MAVLLSVPNSTPDKSCELATVQPSRPTIAYIALHTSMLRPSFRADSVLHVCVALVLHRCFCLDSLFGCTCDLLQVGVLLCDCAVFRRNKDTWTRCYMHRICGFLQRGWSFKLECTPCKCTPCQLACTSRNGVAASVHAATGYAMMIVRPYQLSVNVFGQIHSASSATAARKSLCRQPSHMSGRPDFQQHVKHA